MSLISFLTWMDNLPSSIALRESTWTYPIVESVHSVGICLFVGLTLLWDLRLLGIGLRRIPVSEVWSKLIPWMTLGALIMMTTGVALFYSKPLFFWVQPGACIDAASTRYRRSARCTTSNPSSRSCSHNHYRKLTSAIYARNFKRRRRFYLINTPRHELAHFITRNLPPPSAKRISDGLSRDGIALWSVNAFSDVVYEDFL